MIVGIVGAEAAKFTKETEAEAKNIIRSILSPISVFGFSSGHCHLGGIDIWAEEIAKEMDIPSYIYPPKLLKWEGGYKQRNLQIVAVSDVVHCITVAKLPDSYTGMRFNYCYHCDSTDHTKSGGCWTAIQALKQEKKAIWHVVGKNKHENN